MRIHSLLYTLLAFGAAQIVSVSAQAYPDFIGYGYASCVTCHTNGLGGGPINDYGRGLWAAEIASRSLYPRKMKLEAISNKSGFIGNPENLPYWLRPHFKYRGLWVQRNPGSADKTVKFYHMQLDLGATLYADQDQKYSFTFTAGYVPNPSNVNNQTPDRILTRDYYARVQIGEPFWLYIGKLDKVFGIRNIDHTSYQRAPQELTQNSQSHGVVAHWIQDKYEVAANMFNGDLGSMTPKNEQKGGSLWTEFELQPRSRAGLSVLKSANESQKSLQLAEVHWRQALSKGSAVMFEYGLVQKIDKTLNDNTNGSYTFIESMIQLKKGYHLLVNLERFNRDSAANTPEQWKYGLGILAFPINRVEFRVNATHFRQISSEEAAPDNWALSGQIHVSL